MESIKKKLTLAAWIGFACIIGTILLTVSLATRSVSSDYVAGMSYGFLLLLSIPCCFVLLIPFICNILAVRSMRKGFVLASAIGYVVVAVITPFTLIFTVNIYICFKAYTEMCRL